MKILILLLIAAASAFGEAGVAGDIPHPDGWTESSHGRTAEPDYDLVFPQDSVNRIDIVIAPADWQLMMDDMTELFGTFGETEMPSGGDGGSHRPPGGPPGGSPGVPFPHTGMTRPDSLPFPRPPDGLFPAGASPGGGGGHGLTFGDDRNPIWAEAAIRFMGNEWHHVGIRFKGNSSLTFTWGEGSMKLPFKLDFDEFENEYPEVDNQRFYGFRQLTFSSNFMDASLLREKVTADIFRSAGVPAPHTAFYRVYIDHGFGPVYFGLYTMVEVVDDTVIEEQFSDDGGNVYKPEGLGATFAEDSFSEDAFDKQTNQAEQDWSDVMNLFEVLHSDLRTSNPPLWREDLESVFDVDGFLLWLAVNVIVENWDTYGRSPHNYFLYNAPATGLLTWIPWDNNMALRSDAGLFPVLALDLEDVDNGWPLIRFLMDDQVYRNKYQENLELVLEIAFAPDIMTETYQRFHGLISPFVTGDSGEHPGYTLLTDEDEFNASVDVLVEHIQGRYSDVMAFLEKVR